MSHLNVVRQTQVEKKMLTFLIEGLQNTMAWEIQGVDFSRKLSTLKFIARSFKSHLERLLSLEERDGYMDIVMQSCPHLSKAVDALRQEHDEFRNRLGHIAAGLENLPVTDPNALTHVCDDLGDLLKKVDVHNRKEADIFQEAFEREEGGEG